MNNKSITIDGKEHPIKVTMRHKRWARENAPDEEKRKADKNASENFTLDLMLMVFSEDPKPYKSRDELLDALAPGEYREFDEGITPLLHAMTEEESENFKKQLDKAIEKGMEVDANLPGK